MATLEELTTEATAEIEAAKPMYKQVNNERLEFTDADYDQAVIDKANSDFDLQENGYKQARQEAYFYYRTTRYDYWDGVNGTTLWDDHIAEVKANNPKPE